MTEEQLEHYKQAFADSKFLIANDPNREIDEEKMMATFEHFITTIESQKEEIAEADKNRNETIANFNKIKNEYFSNKKEIESLKAITELAVKGLKEIKSMEFYEGEATPEQKIAIRSLSEIERLQNE